MEIYFSLQQLKLQNVNLWFKPRLGTKLNFTYFTYLHYDTITEIWMLLMELMMLLKAVFVKILTHKTYS